MLDSAENMLRRKLSRTRQLNFSRSIHSTNASDFRRTVERASLAVNNNPRARAVRDSNVWVDELIRCGTRSAVHDATVIRGPKECCAKFLKDMLLYC